MGACRFFAGYVFMQAASPGIAVVVLRYILLKQDPESNNQTPFLLTACYSLLPFLMGGKFWPGDVC